jgi:hypothetical protein
MTLDLFTVRRVEQKTVQQVLRDLSGWFKPCDEYSQSGFSERSKKSKSQCC